MRQVVCVRRESRKPRRQRRQASSGWPTKLREYGRKRDPAQTPEPFARPARRGRAPIFVVQRHDARRLHYDFRLERDGALASWAVPKGVPLEPGVRALAVHVEDHPLDYASVRGRDPEGPVRRRHGRDLGPRHLRARRGEARRRADGAAARQAARGTLDARARRSSDGEEQNWLLIRKPRRPSRAARARRDYRPMLATLAEDAARAASDWVYEVKWDGYRALGVRPRRRGAARLAQRQRPHRALRRASRRRSRRRSRSPTASSTARCARSTSRGARASRRMQQGSRAPLVYEVFDLLELDGEPLVDLPLTRAAGAARARCSTPQRAPSGSRRSSTTARRCSRPRRRRASRA